MKKIFSNMYSIIYLTIYALLKEHFMKISYLLLILLTIMQIRLLSKKIDNLTEIHNNCLVQLYENYEFSEVYYNN